MALPGWLRSRKQRNGLHLHPHRTLPNRETCPTIRATRSQSLSGGEVAGMAIASAMAVVLITLIIAGVYIYKARQVDK